MFLDFLILLNIVTPIICIYKYCYNKSGFKLDHVFIISSGFIYFWMIPLTVYHYNLFSDSINEIDFAHRVELKPFFINDETSVRYLIFIFFIYASFIFGEYISSRIRYKYFRISQFSTKPLSYVLLIYTLLLAILTSVTSGHYFKGYTGSYFSLQGNVIALNLMLLMLLYLKFFHSYKSNNFINIFKSWFFVVYFISTLLLASLGNRTWVVRGVLSFFVLYSNFFKRIPKYFMILGFISLIIVIGVIPILRDAQGSIENLSTLKIIYIAFYDSFASHNGLKYFFIYNEIYMILRLYFQCPLNN